MIKKMYFTSNYNPQKEANLIGRYVSLNYNTETKELVVEDKFKGLSLGLSVGTLTEDGKGLSGSASSLSGGKFITIEDKTINCTLTGLDQLENTPGYITLSEVPSGTVYGAGDGLTLVGGLFRLTGTILKDGDFIHIDENNRINFTKTIPTDLSAFTNGPGYVTIDVLSTEYAKISAVPTKVTDLEDAVNYATTGSIPTKVSQLTDSGSYALTSQIPTAVSDFEDASEYAKTDSIPTKVSQLTNDAQYITNAAIPTINLVVGDAGGATHETTNGNTYVNLKINNVVTDQFKISGTGNVTVVCDSNGDIIIDGQDTQYDVVENGGLSANSNKFAINTTWLDNYLNGKNYLDTGSTLNPSNISVAGASAGQILMVDSGKAKWITLEIPDPGAGAVEYTTDDVDILSINNVTHKINMTVPSQQGVKVLKSVDGDVKWEDYVDNDTHYTAQLTFEHNANNDQVYIGLAESDGVDVWNRSSFTLYGLGATKVMTKGHDNVICISSDIPTDDEITGLAKNYVDTLNLTNTYATKGEIVNFVNSEAVSGIVTSYGYQTAVDVTNAISSTSGDIVKAATGAIPTDLGAFTNIPGYVTSGKIDDMETTWNKEVEDIYGYINEGDEKVSSWIANNDTFVRDNDLFDRLTGAGSVTIIDKTNIGDKITISGTPIPTDLSSFSNEHTQFVKRSEIPEGAVYYAGEGLQLVANDPNEPDSPSTTFVLTADYIPQSISTQFALANALDEFIDSDTAGTIATNVVSDLSTNIRAGLALADDIPTNDEITGLAKNYVDTLNIDQTYAAKSEITSFINSEAVSGIVEDYGYQTVEGVNGLIGSASGDIVNAATGWVNGQDYIKDYNDAITALSIDGKVITYTKKSGTSDTITTQDTTYNNGTFINIDPNDNNAINCTLSGDDDTIIIDGNEIKLNKSGLSSIFETGEGLTGLYDTAHSKYKFDITNTLSSIIASWGFVTVNPDTGTLVLTDPVYNSDRTRLFYLTDGTNNLTNTIHEGTGINIDLNKSGTVDAPGHITISVDVNDLNIPSNDDISGIAEGVVGSLSTNIRAGLALANDVPTEEGIKGIIETYEYAPLSDLNTLTAKVDGIEKDYTTSSVVSTIVNTAISNIPGATEYDAGTGLEKVLDGNKFFFNLTGTVLKGTADGGIAVDNINNTITISANYLSSNALDNYGNKNWVETNFLSSNYASIINSNSQAIEDIQSTLIVLDQVFGIAEDVVSGLSTNIIDGLATTAELTALTQIVNSKADADIVPTDDEITGLASAYVDTLNLTTTYASKDVEDDVTILKTASGDFSNYYTKGEADTNFLSSNTVIPVVSTYVSGNGISITATGTNEYTIAFDNTTLGYQTVEDVNGLIGSASGDIVKAATGWVDGQDYISGITSTNIVTALGYTPSQTDTTYSVATNSGLVLDGTTFGVDTEWLKNQYLSTSFVGVYAINGTAINADYANGDFLNGYMSSDVKQTVIPESNTAYELMVQIPTTIIGKSLVMRVETSGNTQIQFAGQDILSATQEDAGVYYFGFVRNDENSPVEFIGTRKAIVGINNSNNSGD